MYARNPQYLQCRHTHEVAECAHAKTTATNHVNHTFPFVADVRPIIRHMMLVACVLVSRRCIGTTQCSISRERQQQQNPNTTAMGVCWCVSKRTSMMISPAVPIGLGCKPSSVQTHHTNSPGRYVTIFLYVFARAERQRQRETRSAGNCVRCVFVRIEIGVPGCRDVSFRVLATSNRLTLTLHMCQI